MRSSNKDVLRRIEEFKKRLKKERKFCEGLFRWATVRLLAHKYAYYVLCKPYIKDYAYDGEEESWYIMGRALGKLNEDEITPCVDFDWSHSLAKEAMKLAKKYSKNFKEGRTYEE